MSLVGSSTSGHRLAFGLGLTGLLMAAGVVAWLQRPLSPVTAPAGALAAGAAAVGPWAPEPLAAHAVGVDTGRNGEAGNDPGPGEATVIATATVAAPVHLQVRSPAPTSGAPFVAALSLASGPPNERSVAVAGPVHRMPVVAPAAARPVPDPALGAENERP